MNLKKLLFWRKSEKVYSPLEFPSQDEILNKFREMVLFNKDKLPKEDIDRALNAEVINYNLRGGIAMITISLLVDKPFPNDKGKENCLAYLDYKYYQMFCDNEEKCRKRNLHEPMAEDFAEILYGKFYEDFLNRDPKSKKILEKVDKEVERLMENMTQEDKKKYWGWDRPYVGDGRNLGDVHIFSSKKKKILKDRYNIEWKTFAELYPEIKLD